MNNSCMNNERYYNNESSCMKINIYLIDNVNNVVCLKNGHWCLLIFASHCHNYLFKKTKI